MMSVDFLLFQHLAWKQNDTDMKGEDGDARFWFLFSSV